MAPRAWKPRQLRWQVAPAWDGAAELARSLNSSPLLAQILYNRSCSDADTASQFLEPKLTDLHDPVELPGTEAAAERIVRAAADGKRIIIYGDYDVDGMTAVAILHACLRMIGADVHYYVPHRLEEGYGINDRALAKLIDREMEMLITVDCGISAA